MEEDIGAGIGDLGSTTSPTPKSQLSNSYYGAGGILIESIDEDENADALITPPRLNSTTDLANDAADTKQSQPSAPVEVPPPSSTESPAVSKPPVVDSASETTPTTTQNNVTPTTPTPQYRYPKVLQMTAATTYDFVQDDAEITITFQVPSGTTAKDLFFEITPKSIRAGINGRPPIIEGQLLGKADITWQLESTTVTLHCELDNDLEWPCVISGPRIPTDPYSIDPHSQHVKALTIEKDFGSIYHLLKKAAKRGHAASLFQLATLHLEGKPNGEFKLKSDIARALRFYKLAGELGYVDGCFMAGTILHYGTSDTKSVAVDLDEAATWYERCGPEHAEAQFRLGCILTTKQQFVQASYHFHQALQRDPDLHAKIPLAYQEWALKRHAAQNNSKAQQQKPAKKSKVGNKQAGKKKKKLSGSGEASHGNKGTAGVASRPASHDHDHASHEDSPASTATSMAEGIMTSNWTPLLLGGLIVAAFGISLATKQS